MADDPPHPLEGRDDEECYRVMMSERTALITARRESEDSLVKTIIQLAAALVALMAGFVAQSQIEIEGFAFVLFAVALGGLGVSIISGLTEHYFSSKAYDEQQKLVENFYQKVISTFGPAPSNRFVRWAQLVAFTSFVIALVSLGAFALVEAGENNAGRKIPTSTATSTSTAASTAATAAAASSSTAPRTTGQVRRQSQDGRREVSGSVDAATPAP